MSSRAETREVSGRVRRDASVLRNHTREAIVAAARLTCSSVKSDEDRPCLACLEVHQTALVAFLNYLPECQLTTSELRAAVRRSLI
jgi:hypothetical protein